MALAPNPLISIIIPCYNVSDYVEQAINSIISQTYKNLEIWVIDDASTDDTLEKIKTINDDRIKIISYKENTQKVGAVNDVLKKVTGDFITFQDADDWSEPDRIQSQLNAFQNDDRIGICFTNYKFVRRNSYIPKKISYTDEELKNEFLNFSYKQQTELSSTACATMMISKCVLDKTGGYHPYFTGRVGEDIQWIYQILKNFKGITVKKVLYNYRLREGSFTKIQSSGLNAKYAYSWQLLSKIIRMDIHEGINVLAKENESLLRSLELEACEDALVEKIHQLNSTIQIYESSTNFKIGKFFLSPIRSLKFFRK